MPWGKWKKTFLILSAALSMSGRTTGSCQIRGTHQNTQQCQPKPSSRCQCKRYSGREWSKNNIHFACSCGGSHARSPDCSKLTANSIELHICSVKRNLYSAERIREGSRRWDTQISNKTRSDFVSFSMHNKMAPGHSRFSWILLLLRITPSEKF